MENKRLFGLICYLHRQMNRQNNILFAENGITHVQMHVLLHLHFASKQQIKVCQRDLEKEVNLRASAMSTLLGNLEKLGFITRAVSDNDARTKYVEITPKGEEMCLKNKLVMEQSDALIQSALTESEQETFKNLLIKIIDEIESPDKEDNR